MGAADAESSVGAVAVAVAGEDVGEIVESEPRDLTVGDRDAFVAYVAAHKGCPTQEACRAVGVKRKDVKALRRADEGFDEDYRVARGYGTEQILGGMVRLGLEGVEEPVVSAGKIVVYPEGHPQAGQFVTKRVYDSRALIAMFNGMTPEGKAMLAGKLGIEISGPDGGPIKIQGGVPLADMARVLVAAGVDLVALAAGPVVDEIEGEVVAEEDVDVGDDSGAAGGEVPGPS